ncbi:flagellar biosynthesis protein FlgB [Oscillospiraceae bacterium 38-13]
MMDFLSSNSFMMLERSLGYLWTKQAAISDNITNAETPGYKEKIVTFEDSLKQKLALASKGTAPVAAMREVLETTPFSVEEQAVQTRMDDNGVNVTAQAAEAIRNAYQMRYVMSSITTELSILNSAIRGQ